jgi:hypothetical protein
MNVEELMDKFLMKDSETNIHLITTTGIDFSGFNQSTMAIEKTPNKKTTSKQTGQVSNNVVGQNKVNTY